MIAHDLKSEHVSPMIVHCLKSEHASPAITQVDQTTYQTIQTHTTTELHGENNLTMILP